jgi:hypothetical protein
MLMLAFVAVGATIWESADYLALPFFLHPKEIHGDPVLEGT